MSECNVIKVVVGVDISECQSYNQCSHFVTFKYQDGTKREDFLTGTEMLHTRTVSDFLTIQQRDHIENSHKRVRMDGCKK
jgi:hypothetical protein